MTPHLDLTKAYGNEDVYKAKLANAESLVARLSGAMLGWQMGRNVQSEIAEQEEQAQILNEQFQELEHQKMNPVTQALHYTPVPSEGMERLASIAGDAGADLAKTAGIGDFASGITKSLAGSGAAKGFLQKASGSLGSLKWKLPLAAGAVGAGVMAYKGLKKGLNYMNQESPPANWQSGGAQLAYGVNQHGQPQVGSSFQG